MVGLNASSNNGKLPGDTDKRKSFGLLPLSFLQSGICHQLKHAEKLVLFSYLSRARSKSMEAWPGEETIAKDHDIDIRTVTRARKRLVALGLLVDTVKRKRRAKVYKVVLFPKHGVQAMFETGSTGHVIEAKHGVQVHETWSADPSKHGPQALLTEKGTEKGTTTEGIVVVERNLEAKRAACASAGIAEPTLTELASLKHLEYSAMKNIIERSLASGGGPGAIVNALRAAELAAEEKAAKKRRQQEAESRRAHERASQRAAVEKQVPLTPDQKRAIAAEAKAIREGRVLEQASLSRRGKNGAP